MSHLQFHDPVLQYAEVLQFNHRHTTNFDYLISFVENFSPLRVKVEGSMDKLQDGLEDDYDRFDHMWHYLGNLQGCVGFLFNLLFEVVKYILLLLYSNAEEERIF